MIFELRLYDDRLEKETDVRLTLLYYLTNESYIQNNTDKCSRSLVFFQVPAFVFLW